MNRRVFKPFFAPKGPHIKAQGNALGFRQEKQTALKGRHTVVSPLQGDEYQPQKTQGCTLGFRISLLRSWHIAAQRRLKTRHNHHQ
jgi:hypothetical protein